MSCFRPSTPMIASAWSHACWICRLTHFWSPPLSAFPYPKMAVQAPLTGHVVFSTIHANDCVGVVSRLLDMQIDPFLVASSVSLSISQRLVRMSCKHCSVMVEGRAVLRQLRADGVSNEKMARMGLQIDERMPCSQPTGCANCRHTGYAGRQAVFEMLETTSDMRKLIISVHHDIDELKRLAS